MAGYTVEIRIIDDHGEEDEDAKVILVTGIDQGTARAVADDLVEFFHASGGAQG